MKLRPDIRGLEPEELKELLGKAGEKPFRAKQVFQWVQAKAVSSWDEISNIPSITKDLLHEYFLLSPLELLKERVSGDGSRKYLWGLTDGNAVESILLIHRGDRAKKRNTVCLSTQVGCALGCSFCATGKLGYKRNLGAGEIVAQVLDITSARRKENPAFKINNIVYMGMGEPLLNLPAVLKSIKILNHKEGQNIGIRRITLSTCGLVPQIRELAGYDLDIVLAVSLHAPDNELRNIIMPVNRQYPLEELIPACRDYQAQTGRRITFEYALVRGFNDSPENARQLAQLLNGISANVNVIPVNTIKGSPFQKPPRRITRQFVDALGRLGVQAVIREEKGSDIEAACGQLAGEYGGNSRG